MNRNLNTSSRDKTWLWVAVGVVIAGGGALLVLHNRSASQTAAEVTPTPLQSPSAASVEPAHHPIEEAQSTQPAPPAPPLPSLDQSDDVLSSALIELVGQPIFESLFERKDIVRRIVATIDNLPREAVPARIWALKPAAGHFLVSGKDDAIAVAPENTLRYAPYLQLLQAMDARRLVSLYVHHYALFQQSYQQLGYPQGYFNDRLIVVIDNLLAAPMTSSPQRLVQPHVLYQYADPTLEGLSFGQKALMRMGTDDETAIKAKLKEIRALLVKEAPKRL